MSDTISRQKEFLLDAINEAKLMEKKRLHKLDNVKSYSQKEALLLRFERERIADQTKIEQLTNDLLVLKQKDVSGELASLKRVTIGKEEQLKMSDQLPNRFARLENHNQMLFYGDICGKFERHDNKFQTKYNAPVYDAATEYKKLKLLNNKHSLLKQLVNVQAAEVRAIGGEDISSRIAYPQIHYQKYNRSIDERSNVSSDSYATFATKDSSKWRMNQHKSIPKTFVPKLNI
eukprot:gene8370-11325_t